MMLVYVILAVPRFGGPDPKASPENGHNPAHEHATSDSECRGFGPRVVVISRVCFSARLFRAWNGTKSLQVLSVVQGEYFFVEV